MAEIRDLANGSGMRSRLSLVGPEIEPEPIESGRPQAPVEALPHVETGRGA